MTTRVYITLVGASDVLAADKGGTSDPFATAELINISNGKALKKARKTKTTTIKKTLNPIWNHDLVEWDFPEDISEVALKVTVFDLVRWNRDRFPGLAATSGFDQNDVVVHHRSLVDNPTSVKMVGGASRRTWTQDI